MHLRQKILFPFALLYGAVVLLRNFLYDRRILRSTAHRIPVICTGNLSFGGTGKTPMTEYLVRLLKKEYRIAVLSRGYKRTSKGFYLAAGDPSAAYLGDEPYQYYRKFPGIYVAVDANRNRGVRRLTELPEPPDVVLLDDAFQHRKIKAKFNILLTAYAALYVDDLLFPAGNLRDSGREYKRADVVIVTKCPDGLSEKKRMEIAGKLKLKPDQHLFFTTIQYDTSLKSSRGNLHLEALKPRFFTLVTGIANPDPLVNFLEENALSFEHLKYPDHHRFSKKELLMLKQKKCIVTTEKDYVRLYPELTNLYYIPVKTSFIAGEKVFNALIRGAISRKEGYTNTH